MKVLLYSSEFQEMINNPENTQRLVEGSSLINIPGNHYKAWEKARQFVAHAIHKEGTILDIGCGNGFLLRCLQEWASYRLTPYGIDVDADGINQAKILFPNQQQNFAILDIRELATLGDQGIPEKFDFVLWNVWDDWMLETSQQLQTFQEIYDTVKRQGRLILTFYDYHVNEPAICEKLRNFEKRGVEFHGGSVNKNGTAVLAWLDKN